MLLFLKSAVIMLLVNSVFGSVCQEGENAGKKYRAFDEEVNWHSALLNCSRQGMTLATIQSQEEQNNLVNLLEGSRIRNASLRWWIGGTDLHKENDYIWYSTNEPIKYNNFGKNEPSNYKNIEHCLEILVGTFWTNYNYEWNDNECTDNKAYICEYYECVSTSLK